MIYVVAILIPLIAQVFLVVIVNALNTGNGSWIGLGAFLIGLVVIPVTAIVNLIYVKTNNDKRKIVLSGHCFAIAAIVPMLFMLLTFLGLLLE